MVFEILDLGPRQSTQEIKTLNALNFPSANPIFAILLIEVDYLCIYLSKVMLSKIIVV